jgi:uncharacterized RDD family membrane protein YckC
MLEVRLTLLTSGQHQLLNVVALLVVFIPSVAVGLAIRRARQRKAIRDADPNAPVPSWLAFMAAGLELADFRTRLAALAIDVVTVIVVWVIVRAALGTGVTHTVVQYAFLVAYYSLGNGCGGAVGAHVTDVKVVLADGSRPGVVRGTIRHLMSYISGFLVFGYLSGVWDESGQTWHDKLAGTYVVRRHMPKSPQATPAAAPVPTSRAEPQPPAPPPLPPGEHEPGCTRKHSRRQRCTPSDDRP